VAKLISETTSKTESIATGSCAKAA
jgi:hypothetical protein